MKAVIDVNIIIDAFRNRFPDDESPSQILLAIELGYFDGFITADSLTNLYYILHHDTHSKTKTRSFIDATLNIFKILDINETDCRLAYASNRPDFEDSLLIETAKRHKIDYIVTRNTKDFKYSKIPVISPAEFLTKLQFS